MSEHMDICPRDEDVQFRTACISGYQLLDAARNGDLSLCTEIVEASAKDRGPILVRILQVDEQGNSALHLAAQKGHVNVVRYLLSKSYYSVQLKNRNGQTPRSLARRSKRAQVLSAIDEFSAPTKALSPHASISPTVTKQRLEATKKEGGRG